MYSQLSSVGLEIFGLDPSSYFDEVLENRAHPPITRFCNVFIQCLHRFPSLITFPSLLSIIPLFFVLGAFRLPRSCSCYCLLSSVLFSVSRLISSAPRDVTPSCARFSRPSFFPSLFPPRCVRYKVPRPAQFDAAVNSCSVSTTPQLL